MTHPWLTPPVGPATGTRAAIAAALPRIETARLVLRAPRLEDWQALAPIWTTDRAAGIGGPYAEEDGWLDFNQCVAGWILRGFGALTITTREDAAVLGLAVLGHEWGDPEPELGWLLTAEAEGRGFATEAAAALRDWAAVHLDLPLVSYVADGNDASARIAARLHATRDGVHPADAEVAVWRHPQGGAA